MRFPYFPVFSPRDLTLDNDEFLHGYPSLSPGNPGRSTAKNSTRMGYIIAVVLLRSIISLGT